MLTKCSNCHKFFNMKGFETRQVEDGPYEVGFKCPHCQRWYHSHFLNDELKAMQQQMQGTRTARRERRAYQKAFVKFNKKIRRQRGMKVTTVPILRGPK